MRTIFFILPLILFSCQKTPFQIDERTSEKEISAIGYIDSKKIDLALFQSRLNAINENNNDDEVGAYLTEGVHLVTHNNLVFLEFVDLEMDDARFADLEGYKDISESYNTYSGSCKIYELEDEALIEEYQYLIGSKYAVYNHNRDSETAIVEKLVLVYDPWVELPYVAAVFETTDEEYSRYYGWTCRVGAISYPFLDRGEFYEEDAETEIVNIFQNSAAYSQFEDLFAMPAEYEWTESKYSKFEHYDGTEYHIAQYNLIGGCGSLIENLTAVYSEVNGELTLLAMDHIDYYFHDLIDVNGDGFPEFFGADFSSSAIFTIENGKLVEMTAIDWSIDECPC